MVASTSFATRIFTRQGSKVSLPKVTEVTYDMLHAGDTSKVVRLWAFSCHNLAPGQYYCVLDTLVDLRLRRGGCPWQAAISLPSL